MVLLDPIWGTAIGFEVTKRSKTFSTTLEAVVQSIRDNTSDDDSDDIYKVDLVEIQESSKSLLTALLADLAGQCVADWVGDFMDNYPPEDSD
jgi:hypothetical protein